jgi:CheY-like chemotaxis protein
MGSTTTTGKPHATPELPDDTRPLLTTQKTELVGELAQAMANQFNNIMMAVTSYAELELKKATSKEKRSLEQVLNHATRATSLIQKLLDFSRTRERSAQKLEIDHALTDIQTLLNDLLGEHIELTLALGAKSEIVLADRVDVEQTVFALVIIARNATSRGGRLTVSTSVADLDRKFIGTDEATAGKYLVLAVETTEPANGDRLPRPALDQSHKVNLSLAAVRGIVQSCDGLVRFSSERDGSGSFKLYFPVAARDVAQDGGSTLPRTPAMARTILVVEDDDAVRVPAAEFLMMEGFKVLQARTGVEALNVVQQSRSELELLVTDIFMPKMNGVEVASTLLERHPSLKVLYMSGDPGRSSVPGASSSTTSAMLKKPFRLNTLRDKIRDLLGE